MTTIYELADIAATLGVEKNLIKNWTMGRPYYVEPSIRPATGKGSRNLFSRNDLYCFALVHHLNDAGAPVATIQKMLKELKPAMSEDAFWKEQNWALVIRKGPESWYEVEFAAEYSAGFALEPETHVFDLHAVNLKWMIDDVSTKVAVLRGQKRRRGAKHGKIKHSAMEKRVKKISKGR